MSRGGVRGPGWGGGPGAAPPRRWQRLPRPLALTPPRRRPRPRPDRVPAPPLAPPAPPPGPAPPQAPPPPLTLSGPAAGTACHWSSGG